MSPHMSKSELPVMEEFYSLQGEGAHTGSAAYFIRLGGCDVGCHWCDIKESWEASDHPLQNVGSLVSATQSCKTKIAVITGGEPLMYDLIELSSQLGTAGIKRHLETSGVYSLSGEWDWICFSPKKFKVPLSEFYKKSQELKIIVFNRSDLEWAEQQAKKMNDEAALFLQPEWSKEKEMIPLIVEYVKNNPKWRISLQTHKYLNIP
ncbi:MAG: 7-carboxy-7-deazaguanine synthase QueE [Cytophagales bacterium]|nr:7-carboxy-7-deazaguanine synthase QueE [Cytophagales bacterium]